MGSGKTTIGKKLSKNLDLKFLDTDKIIEKKNSMSINQEFLNTSNYNYYLYIKLYIKQWSTNQAKYNLRIS